MSAPWLRGVAGSAAAAALLLPAAPALAHSAHSANSAAQAPAPSAAQAASMGLRPAPATVAKKLFGAWLRRDRHAASRVATAGAVSTIFAYPFRAPDRFAGCTGGRDCRFVHTSVNVPGGLDGILMVVSGSKVVKVYESRHLVKPSAAATHLFKAWRAGDRYRGLEAATNRAVTTLFRNRFDPKGVAYIFQGCNRDSKGYSCAYSYEGGAMFMRLGGSKARGYEVTSIGYIAD
ncbi:hypothetical protein [Microbispora triticiradicis]|uniref:Uncharacterized protein n=2 Tax=Microbispora TaxID=2005 RepID=A0ABY3LXA5_9ACTN|nr:MULTISPECIES: hypothetical protein [Microbispora]TLP58587.1 hypothetical protein FED44_17085 [Microbispora fusca]TYB57713.1 hypothetical protein FXF59_17935 [Microbispora tritici]